MPITSVATFGQSGQSQMYSDRVSWRPSTVVRMMTFGTAQLLEPADSGGTTYCSAAQQFNYQPCEAGDWPDDKLRDENQLDVRADVSRDVALRLRAERRRAREADAESRLQSHQLSISGKLGCRTWRSAGDGDDAQHPAGRAVSVDQGREHHPARHHAARLTADRPGPAYQRDERYRDDGIFLANQVRQSDLGCWAGA